MTDSDPCSSEHTGIADININDKLQVVGFCLIAHQKRNFVAAIHQYALQMRRQLLLHWPCPWYNDRWSFGPILTRSKELVSYFNVRLGPPPFPLCLSVGVHAVTLVV